MGSEITNDLLCFHSQLDKIVVLFSKFLCVAEQYHVILTEDYCQGIHIHIANSYCGFFTQNLITNQILSSTKHHYHPLLFHLIIVCILVPERKELSYRRLHRYYV